MVGASVLPLAAGRLAAQPARARTIGLLAVEAPGYDLFDRLFRRNMADLGYAEGRDVRYVLKVGKPEQLDALAAELVAQPVDLLVTWYTPAALAAKKATRDIPVVMALAGNPVETGIVTSLTRPDGNITGLSGTSAELGRKCMELVREILPASTRVVALANGKDSFSGPFLDMARRGGEATGLRVEPIVIMDPETMADAIAAAKRQGADALLVQPSLPRKRVAALALQARLPAVSVANGFIRDGGLLSYAAHEPDLYIRAAAISDRILKGAAPSSIPIEMPTRYTLQVNLKTARALGIDVPEAVLARADEIDE